MQIQPANQSVQNHIMLWNKAPDISLRSAVFARHKFKWHRSLMSDCYEHGLTASTFDGCRSYQTYVKRIVLFLRDLGLQRRPFIRDQDVALPRTVGYRDRSGETQNLSIILRYTWGVFLAISIAHGWLPLHHKSWRCAIHAGQPCPGCPYHYAVLELFGIFAHIPDVPILILRKIIKGVFNYLTIDRRCVPYDDAVHAKDLFNVMGDDELVVRDVRAADHRIADGQRRAGRFDVDDARADPPPPA